MVWLILDKLLCNCVGVILDIYVGISVEVVFMVNFKKICMLIK